MNQMNDNDEVGIKFSFGVQMFSYEHSSGVQIYKLSLVFIPELI